ncbi:hypothetical protein BH09ACT1_BH09ACT1_23400 [soil metagenome]
MTTERWNDRGAEGMFLQRQVDRTRRAQENADAFLDTEYMAFDDESLGVDAPEERMRQVFPAAMSVLLAEDDLIHAEADQLAFNAEPEQA